jgi:predicted Zn-dependent peptidase
MSLGNRIIGYKDTVNSVEPDAIRDYMSKRYTCDNIVISIAGNFDPDRTIPLVESAFAGAPHGRIDRPVSVAAHTPRYASRARDIEQSHILFGKRGVKLDADDYYAFALYNNVLGGGMSSRLFQSIREEKGLAYSVYSTSNAFLDDGIFMIYAGVSDGKERMTVDAIREEIERLAADGISAGELRKVKEQSKGAYVFGRENVQARMFSNGKNELLLGRIFDPDEIIAGIEAVTGDDISRIAKECADIGGYSAVVVGKNEFTRDEIGL